MKRSYIVALALALGACSSPPSVTPSPPQTVFVAPATTVTPTLPPQGVYNSCETDTALTSLCEPEDAAIAGEGFKWEIDYIGLMATKTSLRAWFKYDASIGLGQVIAINRALNDSVDVLAGTVLTNFNGDSNLAKSCGATNNLQIVSCVDSVARSVPGFDFMWYLYDEPGCPKQSLGFCRGTLAGGNYLSVVILSQYLHTIDPSHQTVGTQVGDVGSQGVTDAEFSWLMEPPMPSTSATGFDHYPVPQRFPFGKIADNAALAGQLARAAAKYNPSESIYYVGQAFSWYQEQGENCTSVAVCPFPTTAQMQSMRDQALYYAAEAKHPLSWIFWFYWPDTTCLQVHYPGCNAAANRASLKSAAFAPFPTKPPE
jgi:hypothetical protein